RRLRAPSPTSPACPRRIRRARLPMPPPGSTAYSPWPLPAPSSPPAAPSASRPITPRRDRASLFFPFLPFQGGPAKPVQRCATLFAECCTAGGRGRDVPFPSLLFLFIP